MRAAPTIPLRAGVGLKARHCGTIVEQRPDVGWFEVHAENYMGAGGPPLHALETIRRDYPLSIHGVGLSIGGADPLDEGHLARLKALVERFEPGLVSEHLAWSSHGGIWFNDLLPLPYTPQTLARVCDNIDRLQEVLGRAVLLENPSTYVTFETSTLSETDFIAAALRRTGCGLLLDVNNVYVSAVNHGFSPEDYIAVLPAAAIGEIHLAGHAGDRDEAGRRLLLDAHDRPVAGPVWTLYADTVARTGRHPTLIEWDNDVPEWPALMAEAAAAEAILDACEMEARRAAAG